MGEATGLHEVVGDAERGAVWGLVEVVTGLARQVDTEGEEAALQSLLDHGAPRLMQACWGWVTVTRRGRHATVASTDDSAAALADALCRAGCGPVPDAVTGGVVVTPDISTDHRWTSLGPRLHDEFGVRSIVSYSVPLFGDDERTAALSFASGRADAFSPHRVDCGRVLAAHAGLLVAAQTANATARHLHRALESNREIGIAVGVLMAQRGLTRCQAFAVLRAASQDTNRKLAVVATDVADSGALPQGGPVRSLVTDTRRWHPDATA